MRCDVCEGNATRAAVHEKTARVMALCKHDAKRLPDSDTQRKAMKPQWRVSRLR